MEEKRQLQEERRRKGWWLRRLMTDPQFGRPISAEGEPATENKHRVTLKQGRRYGRETDSNTK